MVVSQRPPPLSPGTLSRRSLTIAGLGGAGTGTGAGTGVVVRKPRSPTVCKGSFLPPSRAPSSSSSTCSLSSNNSKPAPRNASHHHNHHNNSNPPLSSSKRRRERAYTKTSSSTSTLTTLIHKLLLGLVHNLGGTMFQLLVLLVIFGLVVQSHYQANLAEQQLRIFQQEESLLLLQLSKMEVRSIQLHENIRRRLRSSIAATTTTTSEDRDDTEESSKSPPAQQQQQAAAAAAAAAKNSKNGNDPLGAQTSELYQMSKELHSQVSTLQESLQEKARDHIVEEFGEGAVKVVLELQEEEREEPPTAAAAAKYDGPAATTTSTTAIKRRTRGGGGGGIQDRQTQKTTSASNNNNNNNNAKKNKNGKKTQTHRISLVLWPDTPHAAWTWLEQISRHVWDDATFEFQQQQQPGSSVLQVTPSKDDPLGRGRLEFVEQAPLLLMEEFNNNNNNGLHSKWHTAWTVGLREQPAEDGYSDKTKLQLFFNLQDNADYRQHETCIGKVLDGFDALQRLLEATRDSSATGIGDAAPSTVMRITRVNAMHLTRREHSFNL